MTAATTTSANGSSSEVGNRVELGRAYLVESGLEQDSNAAVRALVTDYIEQAAIHLVIPVGVPVERYVDHLDG